MHGGVRDLSLVVELYFSTMDATPFEAEEYADDCGMVLHHLPSVGTLMVLGSYVYMTGFVDETERCALLASAPPVLHRPLLRHRHHPGFPSQRNPLVLYAHELRHTIDGSAC